MNLLKRALKANIQNNKMMFKHLDTGFTTKDLYLNELVMINFIAGYELYYYIIKDSHGTDLNKILDSMTVLERCLQCEKVLSIELNSLKVNQFKREQNNIIKFINCMGDL